MASSLALKRLVSSSNLLSRSLRPAAAESSRRLFNTNAVREYDSDDRDSDVERRPDYRVFSPFGLADAFSPFPTRSSLSQILHKGMYFLSQLLALSVLLVLILRRRSNKKMNSPPEPSRGWPIIGHLHLLGQKIPASKALGSMADKLGPVFALRLGVNRNVVVSSWEAVRDCFTTNDKVLAKRPTSPAAIHLGYNYAGFVFSDGPYWREIKKLVVMEVLSARRLDALKLVREAEIESSFNELYERVRVNPGEEVVMSDWFEQLTMNTLTMLIGGKKCTERDGSDGGNAKAASLRHIVKQLRGMFAVLDPIPFLRWLDLRGHMKALKRVADELSSIAEEWIHEHVERRRIAGSGDDRDFIDVMLSTVDDKFDRFGHTRLTIIKATILNLIIAGSDSTSIHLTWILSLLLNNPRVMQQVRAEIDEKVGQDRWVQDSDIKNLVYLQVVSKETLRLFPPGPMALPHEAMEDCIVNGYHIPKGTRILVNLWKLHRDPRVWEEPDEFVPERFLTKHVGVDFKGHHNEFIPFGSGRRSCLGTTLAMEVTHLTMARLIQGFEFQTPLDEPVDMTEGLGVTLPKATPLQVIVEPRLSPTMYGYQN